MSRHRARPAPLGALAAGLLALVVAGCTSGSDGSHGTSADGSPAAPATTPISAGTSRETTPPPTTHAPTTSASTARTVTVPGSGDVLIHPPPWHPAHRDPLAERR